MLTVGVDIGYQTIKIVGVRHGLFGARLVGASLRPIPKETLTKTGIEHPEELAKAIREGLKAANLSHHTRYRVTSAMPASVIFTKRLEVPRMGEAELAASMPFEATQAFPIPLEELIIDWLILSRSTTTMTVLLIGAPKALAQKMVELFDHQTLELTALEIKPIANVRASIGDHESGRYLLADIGAVESSLAVVDHGQLEHVATLDFGASHLVSEPQPGSERKTAIRQELLPPSVAEKPQPAVKSLRAKQAGSPLGAFVKPLADEVRQVRKFIDQHVPGQALHELRLCGGGAATPGLATAVASETDLHVKLANPLVNLRAGGALYQQKDLLSLTTAVGLALRLDRQ